MSDIRAHIMVQGRVQGVGFRWFALNYAEKLGLFGWVRNNFNGSVESEVEGDRSAVEEYITQMKVGPRWSHVSAIDLEYKQYEGKYTHFEVTR